MAEIPPLIAGFLQSIAEMRDRSQKICDQWQEFHEVSQDFCGAPKKMAEASVFWCERFYPECEMPV